MDNVRIEVTNGVGRNVRLELPRMAVAKLRGRYIISPYEFGGLPISVQTREPLMSWEEAERVTTALGSLTTAGTWEAMPAHPLRGDYSIKLRGATISEGRDLTEAEILDAVATQLNRYGRYQSQRRDLEFEWTIGGEWQRIAVNELIPIVTSEGQRLQAGYWYIWQNTAPNEWVGRAVNRELSEEQRELCEGADIVTSPEGRAYQFALGELSEIDLPTWLGYEGGGYTPEGEQAVIAGYYRPLQDWAHKSEGYNVGRSGYGE